MILNLKTCATNAILCNLNSRCRLLQASDTVFGTTQCVLKRRCESDCSLCDTTGSPPIECELGPALKCEIDTVNNQCIPTTCGGSCDLCDNQNDCESSTAEPNGCIYDGLECTAKPTTTILPTSAPTKCCELFEDG